MAKGDTQGCGTVWMATGTDSVKVADFKRNPKAGLCYDKGGSKASILCANGAPTGMSVIPSRPKI